MNGFVEHGLDEGNFGDAKGISVKAFDAFRRSLLYLTCLLLKNI